MVAALDRYEELESLGIRGLNLSHIPPMRLKALAQYAATGWAPNIARMPDDRRMATLVAFAYAFETETLDDALDLLDMLIADIAASAKHLRQKNRLRTLRDLDQAAIALAEICGMLLDDSCTAPDVRTAIFTRFPQERIVQAIGTTSHLRDKGVEVRPEDVARLSPLQHKHINVLGRYSFALAGPIAMGELRPLHFGGWDESLA